MRIIYGLFLAFSEGLPQEQDPKLLVELIQEFVLGSKQKDDQVPVCFKYL